MEKIAYPLNVSAVYWANLNLLWHNPYFLFIERFINLMVLLTFSHQKDREEHLSVTGAFDLDKVFEPNNNFDYLRLIFPWPEYPLKSIALILFVSLQNQN